MVVKAGLAETPGEAETPVVAEAAVAAEMAAVTWAVGVAEKAATTEAQDPLYLTFADRIRAEREVAPCHRSMARESTLDQSRTVQHTPSACPYALHSANRTPKEAATDVRLHGGQMDPRWTLGCWVPEDDLALMCRLKGVDASLMWSARLAAMSLCLSSCYPQVSHVRSCLLEQIRHESLEAFERD